MNEGSAVDRVFAVIARVVMAAMNIDRPFIHERVQASGNIFQRGRRVARVLSRIGGFLLQDTIDLLELAGHIGHFGRSSVARFVGEASEGQLVRRAATLVVNSEGVGSAK